jgi:uncharacterized protein (DUF2249 family)
MQNIPLTDVSDQACTCGLLHEEDYPALDVRGVPHAIRHGVVFGALESLAQGSGLILVAPHDPLPLLAQIDGRTPGRYTVTYLSSGPDAWHLQFVRSGTESTGSVSADATP